MLLSHLVDEDQEHRYHRKRDKCDYVARRKLVKQKAERVPAVEESRHQTTGRRYVIANVVGELRDERRYVRTDKKVGN